MRAAAHSLEAGCQLGLRLHHRSLPLRESVQSPPVRPQFARFVPLQLTLSQKPVEGISYRIIGAL